MMDRETVKKHVEFYSKNKFEKLLHLVGFIINFSRNNSLYMQFNTIQYSSCLNNKSTTKWPRAEKTQFTNKNNELIKQHKFSK